MYHLQPLEWSGITLLVILAVHILQFYWVLWCWHICLFVCFIYINHFVIINSPIKHHTVLINLATQRNICPASNSVPQWTSVVLEEPFWGCDSSLGIYTFTIIYTFTHSHLSVNHESDDARKPFYISFHGCRVLSVHSVLPVTLTFAHLFGVYLSQYTFGYLGPFWFHRTYRIFYYYESDFYSPVCLNLLLHMRVHTICAHNCMLIMPEPGIFMCMGIAFNLHISLSVVIFTIHLSNLFYYFYFMCVCRGPNLGPVQ